MKRGSTATISIVRFRAAWTDHTPIADLCTMFTITKDQVIRLRDVWHLPKRHDRRMRAKPERHRDPTPDEIQAACVRIQATWDDRTREMRCVCKTEPLTLKRISISEIGEPPHEDET